LSQPVEDFHLSNEQGWPFNRKGEFVWFPITATHILILIKGVSASTVRTACIIDVGSMASFPHDESVIAGHY
jgi:hypothetical protein